MSKSIFALLHEEEAKEAQKRQASKLSESKQGLDGKRVPLDLGKKGKLKEDYEDNGVPDPSPEPKESENDLLSDEYSINKFLVERGYELSYDEDLGVVVAKKGDLMLQYSPVETEEEVALDFVVYRVTDGKDDLDELIRFDSIFAENFEDNLADLLDEEEIAETTQASDVAASAPVHRNKDEEDDKKALLSVKNEASQISDPLGKLNITGIQVVDAPNGQGKVLNLSINGKEYSYRSDTLSAEELMEKLLSIGKHSVGRAVSWLKQNSVLVVPSKEANENPEDNLDNGEDVDEVPPLEDEGQDDKEVEAASNFWSFFKQAVEDGSIEKLTIEEVIDRFNALNDYVTGKKDDNEPEQPLKVPPVGEEGK